MTFRRSLRCGVAAICIAGLVAPAGAAPRPTPPGFDVHVGQAADFSRIEFQGAGRVTPTRDGQTVTLTFGRDADPDISRLRTAPPRWIKAAEKRHVGGRLQIVLSLTDDAEFKLGQADGATYVNVFQRAAPEPPKATPVADSTPEPPRANPVPKDGTVHVQAKVVPGQVSLTFPWANPVGAAVFRRGDSLWLVFDAPASLDLRGAPHGVTQFSTLQPLKGSNYTALRIEGTHGAPVFATAQASSWTVAIGPGEQGPPTLIHVSRDATAGPATLKAPVAGVARVLQVPDALAGDSLTVVTALGPAKGLPSRRDYAQLAMLPSAQGLAIEPYVTDLSVTYDGDIVKIARAHGLALSSAAAGQAHVNSGNGAPMPASMPALIDYANWPKTGPGGFLPRYNQLVAAAAAESGNKDKGASTAARMGLARFLVGSDLSFEAIGVLNDVARSNPQLLENGEFRGLRGVARVMARRYKEAQTDFSAPVLVDDASAAAWRGYISAQLAQWSDARAQFIKGADAYAQFPQAWRAKFARADAQAALAQGDLDTASARIRLALVDRTDAADDLETRLVQARIVEMQGSKDRALRIYDAIATAPIESLSSPAKLRATQIRLETGKLQPAQASVIFDGLRYRWRGDGTELETIRALGQLYLAQGRYREALEALRSAGKRMPDLPEALQLQSDLAAAFRALFLDGNADGLEPIQALALFYDFKELTPIGADGDLMVRKLVRRLIDVDLLDQAAELLKYQADNRLDGVPRAQVATDLAVIYLMNKQPEKAIEAINASRTTVLPAALNAERRLIEARAWTGVGHYDAALEILDRDASKDAQDLRGEITWKQKDWAKAGPFFEKGLGDRWKNPNPLTAEEEGRLLRAGVAFSLAGDDASLARLNREYQSFLPQAHNPEALRIALTGVSGGRLSVADFGRVSADNEAFAGWVSTMKTRFKSKPAPVGPAKAAPTAKTATAAPTKSPAKG